MVSYGYIRVSSTEQNEDRQAIALQKQGIPPRNIFMDKQSGKDFNRPRYKALLRRLAPGDLLFVHSIDRLGRSYGEIQNQWRILTKERRVDIIVLDMPLLDTRVNKDLMGTFIADIVLQILSFVAQSERESIRKRQSEGIAAARARGVHLGRHATPLPDDFPLLADEWAARRLRTIDFMRLTGLSETSLYRHLRAAGVRRGKKKPAKR